MQWLIPAVYLIFCKLHFIKQFLEKLFRKKYMNQQDKGQSEWQRFTLPLIILNNPSNKDKKSTNKNRNIYESIFEDKCVFDEFPPYY